MIVRCTGVKYGHGYTGATHIIRSLLREQFHFCFLQSTFGRSMGDYTIETFCEIQGYICHFVCV